MAIFQFSKITPAAPVKPKKQTPTGAVRTGPIQNKPLQDNQLSDLATGVIKQRNPPAVHTGMTTGMATSPIVSDTDLPTRTNQLSSGIGNLRPPSTTGSTTSQPAVHTGMTTGMATSPIVSSTDLSTRTNQLSSGIGNLKPPLTTGSTTSQPVVSGFGADFSGPRADSNLRLEPGTATFNPTYPGMGEPKTPTSGPIGGGTGLGGAPQLTGPIDTRPTGTFPQQTTDFAEEYGFMPPGDLNDLARQAVLATLNENYGDLKKSKEEEQKRLEEGQKQQLQTAQQVSDVGAMGLTGAGQMMQSDVGRIGRREATLAMDEFNRRARQEQLDTLRGGIGALGDIQKSQYEEEAFKQAQEALGEAPNIVANADGTMTETLEDGSRVTYDSSGKEISRTDAEGNNIANPEIFNQLPTPEQIDAAPEIDKTAAENDENLTYVGPWGGWIIYRDKTGKPYKARMPTVSNEE